MIEENHQLQLAVGRRELPNYKLVYGFVGSMEDSKLMEDTCTPVILQVVVKLPYRFGKTEAEFRDSWVFARVNAFASRACLAKSFEAVTLGTPITGVLDCTNSDYRSAQLVGCL